jgi:hypothetical protein
MNGNGRPTLRDARYVARDVFFYEINLSPAGGLAPSASIPGTVNIDTDSDFFWQKSTQHSAVASDGTTYENEELPECDITIKDATTGRDIMNAPVPISNIFGNGRIPFILPVEKYFGARSQISVTVNNVSDNKTYTSIKLTFVGIKAFTR